VLEPDPVRSSHTLLGFAAMLTACSPAGEANRSAARGKAVIVASGCGACHRIPGIQGADGKVGPPLDGVGRRTILAGVLPNTPGDLALWIRAPQSVKPGDAMPDSALGEREARDVATYLETH
jgi:cytochrome c1